MYMHLSVSDVHVSAGTCRGQKKVPDPLEFKLQVVMSHLTWVLRTKTPSSARGKYTFNH